MNRRSSTPVGREFTGLVGPWWQPFAHLEDVVVVHLDLTPGTGHEHDARAWLDPDEQTRWRRFRHEGARRRYALCRAALRSLLCDALECANENLTFETGRHGKPSVAVNGRHPPVSFNVSHSGSHGMIALARQGRVGVDVEERAPRRNLALLIDAVLSPAEQDELDRLDGLDGLNEAGSSRKLELFLNLWTLKEALSKAYGKGLSMDVSRIEIPECLRRGAGRAVIRLDDTPDTDTPDTDAPDTAWRLAGIGNDSFAAAVAHEMINTSP